MQIIYCPSCGAEFCVDDLHDRADDLDSTFAAVQRDFQVTGCLALGESRHVGGDRMRAEVSSAMFDLMGDDIDGVAAMMEDFEYFGMLGD